METLALGMRALNFSSRIAFEEEESEDGKPVEFPEKAFFGTMLLALVFVVAVFFAAPILLANVLERWDVPRFWIVLVEGLLRLGLFVGYIAAIGLIPDIRRVFQYHGAEHMTIHAYEAGRPLTVAEVRNFPKEHQRCGTSFLLVVVVVALLTFFVFDLLVDEGLAVRTASRILLVPLIAGVSYEILRFGARYRENGFVRALFAPNIALQGLTTKVPDDSQVEVAIASFEATLAAAGLRGGEQAAAPEDAEFSRSGSSDSRTDVLISEVRWTSPASRCRGLRSRSRGGMTRGWRGGRWWSAGRRRSTRR
ncbi:DUF1385 domain-containing protein [Tepidiforma flava]|uniref:DUF1385 domain-containing protein n=1 Tax=Tepidiforma flava TaxID=3004094 RepID=A0ABY7M7U5_9CHLR|nr:DUF1385 domain-containing protein [Tepidiforma flava]WBL36094.1 DUF1385 domain-containing protein [Tepidiforma flava]